MTISLVLLALAGADATLSGQVTIGGKPARAAVVFLAGYGKPKPIKATIEQIDKTFRPRVLAVPVGSTVSFPNRDAIFHNVFAEHNAKRFDLGMYPKGQTRTVTFDQPGVANVLCNIHAEMCAFVVVVDSTAYALTDGSGNFTLKGVEPGTYTLVAWHESGAKASQTIAVGKGEKINLKLTRK